MDDRIIATLFAGAAPLPGFSPSTRIDHAWLVVEAMRDEYYFEMARGRDGYTYAMFQPYGTGDSQISEATAPTAPLAICRAAIAAMEAK